MVWHVYEAVFLANLFEHRLLAEELRSHHWLPALVLQFEVSAVGERHQVAVVLVSATGERRVEFAHVESVEHALLHFARHVLVVNHADSHTTLARVYAQRNLLHSAVVGEVVHLHLSVLCELERVGLVV